MSSCLCTVTGEKVPIHGKSDLQVEIVIPHQMWVADITDKRILGMDFLEHHGCQVDLKQGILFLVAEEEVPLQQPQKDTEPSSCQVIAQDMVSLSLFLRQ